MDKTVIFSRKIVIGRDPDNYKVTLEMEVEKVTGMNNMRTINLKPIKSWKEFSISGFAQYRPQCDYSYCGQIQDEIRENVDKYKFLAIPKEKIIKILELWDRWHLNDLHAGTRKQEALLKKSKIHDYTERCNFLTSNDFQIDRGYMYGSAWLVELLPPTFIDDLQELLGEEESK